MVYFIRAGASGPVKIGYTSRDIKQRLASLQCGHPEELLLLAAVSGDRTLEAELHQCFASHRLSGEWFSLGSEQVLEVVASLVRSPRRETGSRTKNSTAASNAIQGIVQGKKQGLDRERFAAAYRVIGARERIPSAALADGLAVGKKELSLWLAPYGIRPRPMRTSPERVERCYLVADFQPPWQYFSIQ